MSALRAGLLAAKPQVVTSQVRHSGGLYGQLGFKNFRKNFLHSAEEAGKHAELWKKIALFGVIPAMVLCHINTYMVHEKEHHQPRPEFVKYDYLAIRNKEFPWGGFKTFFHNPHTNALPEGYETEDPHAAH